MPLPDRIRLVVLFGGRSAEHDVSCVSARHVIAAADPDRYRVVPVAITRDGQWRVAEGPSRALERGAAELAASLGTDGPPVGPLDVLVPLAEGEGAADGPVPTVVVPVLHGPNGEDGTVQGLLEVAGVPYVGAGVLGSAVAMDKAMAKTVLDAHGIPQPLWREVHRRDLEADPDRATELVIELGDPVFVKPANMGSSVGVTKARGPEQVTKALRTAFAYDDVAVVEEAVDAHELECAVLGDDEMRISTVGEVVPGAEFYDYADKYADGVARTIIPAPVGEEVIARARRLAGRAYRALRVEGMARVDMFLRRDTGELLVNELNSIPGFTPISMYPMLWEASGLSVSELLDELVELALERHQRRSRRHLEPGATGELPTDDG